MIYSRWEVRFLKILDKVIFCKMYAWTHTQTFWLLYTHDVYENKQNSQTSTIYMPVQHSPPFVLPVLPPWADSCLPGSASMKNKSRRLSVRENYKSAGDIPPWFMTTCDVELSNNCPPARRCSRQWKRLLHNHFGAKMLTSWYVILISSRPRDQIHTNQ